MNALRYLLFAASLALVLCNPLRAQTSLQQPAAEDLSQFQSPDALMAHIQRLQTGRAQGHDEMVTQFNHVIAAVDEFQRRYPTDSLRWKAKLAGASAKYTLQIVQTGQRDFTTLEADARSVADASDAPKEVQASARIMLIQLHSMAAGRDTLPLALNQEILSFIQDFPQSPSVLGLQQMRLTALEKSDPAQAAVLEATLLNDSNPAIVKMAQAHQRVMNLAKAPLDLRFTAVDGTMVDLARLRGKVVLIDFWATWCGPCMAEVPEVVRTYNDLHDRGFEVIGISLDQDQSRVESVTKEKGMVWPQYFDGKGWQNEIVTTYGIRAIPHMWLVNKQGIVADPDVVRGTLPQQVQKLLEE